LINIPPHPISISSGCAPIAKIFILIIDEKRY
jgi:hypothetical protein